MWFLSSLRGVALGLGLAGLFGPAHAEDLPVDVQLIAAADVSDSMHDEIGTLQRKGYARALRSQVLADAIRFGRYGRIAFTYLEWGDAGRVEVIVPWTLIDSGEDALAVARQLEETRINTFLKTSISHVLGFSGQYFRNNGFAGDRVIDVSGNGPNNQGGGVEIARDRLVADGITINGLPIMTGIEQPRGAFGNGFDLTKLDQYYADCVIGGPGAFVLPVYEQDDLTQAIKIKLVLEVADLGHLFQAQFLAPPAQRTPC